MLRIELVNINGKTFTKNWSDINHYIERDGLLYCEAYDPVDTRREYIETDILIENEEDEEIEE